MGYEGHLMVLDDRDRQRAEVAAAMERLRAAHADVGGDVVSAGGTGTYDLHESTGRHRDPGRQLRPHGHLLRHARPAVPPGRCSSSAP